MKRCEEEVCSNFQSVICLHCMQRLCMDHLEVHQMMLSDSIKQVNDDVMDLHMALTDASNAIVEQRTKEEQKLEIWRSERLASIEREYNHNMKLIKSRQLVLEEVNCKLNQRLKVEVQQPLEEMFSKQNVNPELLGVIQSTIDTIKINSKSFT